MTVAIFDAGYMARRSFFAMGRGKQFDRATTYGFLRDVLKTMSFFRASTAVFCFDSPGAPKRREIYPPYKAGRRKRREKMNDAERAAENEFHVESAALPGILREIGFSNIFSQPGYEADDLIAAAVRGFRGLKYLISADQDLWQLLRPGITAWNPTTRRAMSFRRFVEMYKIEPDKWIAVKSIAGCNSDDIPGVIGVGEATAIRYLRGGLRKSSKLYGRIRDADEMIKTNRALVRLPYPGTQRVEPQPRDRASARGWTSVIKSYDMPSLVQYVDEYYAVMQAAELQ